MGAASPNFGPLTDAMLLDSPAQLPAGALQAAGRAGDRAAARAQAHGALLGGRRAGRLRRRAGLPGDRSSDYGSGRATEFTLEDNTADGSSAAWVAVGPPMPLADLAALPVELSVDGEVVERGVGAAASGHPAVGLVWLAEQLAGSERALEPGDLVITGGLTSARPLEAGHRVSASFGDGQWSVEVRRPR